MRVKFFDLNEFVRHFGYLGIGLCVFAETGLFFGIALPGESLLIIAGIMSAQSPPVLDHWTVIAIVFVASVLGNQLGYLIGQWMGPALHSRPDGRFLKQKYLHRADRYFNKYGNRTVLFARFIPVVRTFGPLTAGITRMNKRAFFIYNVFGGIIWSVSMVLLGHYAGGALQRRGVDIEKWIIPIVIVVVVISLIPAYFELRHEEEEIIEDSPSASA